MCDLTYFRVTNAINTRGKQLVLDLNEICDSKLKTLDEKKTALDQLSAITDHTIEFVNSVLEQVCFVLFSQNLRFIKTNI